MMYLKILRHNHMLCHKVFKPWILSISFKSLLISFTALLKCFGGVKYIYINFVSCGDNVSIDFSTKWEAKCKEGNLQKVLIDVTKNLLRQSERESENDANVSGRDKTWHLISFREKWTCNDGTVNTFKNKLVLTLFSQNFYPI